MRSHRPDRHQRDATTLIHVTAAYPRRFAVSGFGGREEIAEYLSKEHSRSGCSEVAAERFADQLRSGGSLGVGALE
jgi:hypothetical protein